MALQNQHRKTRTYARNRAWSRRGYEKVFESDGVYFLKLVVCVLLGTLWLKFGTPLATSSIVINALPVGLIIGLLLIRLVEKHQSNRKIGYAVIIVVAVVSYLGPAGVVI